MQLKSIVGIVFALAATAPVAAATVLNVTDLNTSTAYDFTITATSGATDVSFAGYNLPSFIELTNINFSDSNASSTNLLAPTFTFTPAPAGSDAFTFNDGSSVQGIALGSVVVGSNDTFSQTVATTVGDRYHLTFDYSNGDSPSGLIVSTSGAVPEPASWALMIGGLAMTGVALRRRKVALAA